MSRIAGWLFASFAAGTLAFYAALALGLATRGEPLHWATKPLVVPALLAWVVCRTAGTPLPEIRRRAFHAALVFSALGDVLLIPRDRRSHLLGIAAFGVAHVCYVVAFVRVRHVLVAARRPESLALVALATIGFGLRALTAPGLKPEVRGAFDVYAVLILGTCAAALVRLVALRDRSSAALLAGSLLFLVSDGLIALGASGLRFPSIELAVMTTYVAAQALLARGVVLAGSGAP